MIENGGSKIAILILDLPSSANSLQFVSSVEHSETMLEEIDGL